MHTVDDLYQEGGLGSRLMVVMRPRIAVSLLLGRQFLAVMNQSSFDSNGADKLHFDGAPIVDDSHQLGSNVREVLQRWYKDNIKTVVDAIPPPLAIELTVLGGAVAYMVIFALWLKRTRYAEKEHETEGDLRNCSETLSDLDRPLVPAKYADYTPEHLSAQGSRMKKSWYTLKKKESDKEETEDEDEIVLLTNAPVPDGCPLLFSRHEKHLKNVFKAIKLHKHPFIQPIYEVEYEANGQMVAIVQPLWKQGSLKDLIYNVEQPFEEWSKKYARCGKGLPPDKVALYGRQIIEAMKFLYSQGFSTIGHVQTGNVFVVNDICKVGGYDNALLGYKTRLYRLCKDHTAHLDVILFGHLIFEMSAGYELTQLRPEVEEFEAVPSSVRPILEFIFADEFPHTIDDIACHQFFAVPLPELETYNPDSVQLTDSMKESMKKIMEKVRKNKPRVQSGAEIERRTFKQLFTRRKDVKDDKVSSSSNKSRNCRLQ